MPPETPRTPTAGDIDLGIATDKICHIIVKARASVARQADDDPDSAGQSGENDTRFLPQHG